MSEFAELPFYDIARLTSVLISGGNPNMYTNIPDDIRTAFKNQFKAYWSRYGAILPEEHFNASSPYVMGGANDSYTPYLYAFNPILSPVTCGSKMQLYAALYKKFKYVGIKVSWHPLAKPTTTVVSTSNTISPGMHDETYQAYSLDAGKKIDSFMNSGTTQGFYLKHNTMERTVRSKEFTPVSTQTLYMHVYFGKQIESSQNWHLPFLSKISENKGVTGYAVSHGMNNNQDGRMKVASFYDINTMMPCIERDSKLHKVYDMSKPFSFFVRPMVSSNETTKEAATNVAHEAEEITTQPANGIEYLQKGLKHLGYKEFNHALTSNVLDIPQDAYAAQHAHDINDKYYHRWAALSNDDNFFNPVMFWYCFTTSDRYVPNYADYMDAKNQHQLFNTSRYFTTTGTNSNAKYELSSRIDTSAPFLTGYGYFDVTFYTKWKEERPLVSKTSYVGIVPSETGVEGVSSIIA
uniref:Capsid protein n=1 Tax=Circular ssDNA virus sp. TaxID=2805939 RepID=A0A894JLC3_9VIRU|nr:capsid protein [Circular ssDNA virus sp.]